MNVLQKQLRLIQRTKNLPGFIPPTSQTQFVLTQSPAGNHALRFSMLRYAKLVRASILKQNLVTRNISFKPVFKPDTPMQLSDFFSSDKTLHALSLFDDKLVEQLEQNLFYKNGKPYLRCTIRDKDIQAKPEEIVRQLCRSMVIPNRALRLNIRLLSGAIRLNVPSITDKITND
jgi:hypothetical protein